MKHAIERIGESGMLPINKQAARGLSGELTGADLRVAKLKQAEKDRVAKLRRRARQRRSPSAVLHEPPRLWDQIKYKLEKRFTNFAVDFKSGSKGEIAAFVSGCDELLIDCATKLPRRIVTFTWMVGRRLKRLPYAARSSPELLLYISKMPKTCAGYGADTAALRRFLRTLWRRPRRQLARNASSTR